MPRHRALAQTLNIALLLPTATMASMSGRYASSSPLASRVIPQNKVKKIIPTPASVKSGSPWPYTAEDLRRHDESPDVQFYSHPRFVTHIDGGCIDSLRDNVYASIFQEGDDVLDVCSSWISHFPDSPALRLTVGIGMNEEELRSNPRLASYVVQDLNLEPTLPYEDGTFNVVTNAVSVDYLARPQELFNEFFRVLKPGGIAIMAFSNRMFPTKVVSLWLKLSDEERVQMVMTYFLTCGAEFIDVRGYEIMTAETDPLFVVTGRKSPLRSEGAAAAL